MDFRGSEAYLGIAEPSYYEIIVENFKDSIIKSVQKFVVDCKENAKCIEGEESNRSYYLKLNQLSISAAEEAIQQYWYHRGYE